MKQETLLSIKKEIRKFSNLYEKLIKMWNGELPHGDNATHPETIQIGVILHNMAFNASDCMGYNHEEAVAKFEELMDVLRAINEYHGKCYMTHYAWNEVSSIYEGETMEEDINYLK